MRKPASGFFERLTGARILTKDTEEKDVSLGSDFGEEDDQTDDAYLEEAVNQEDEESDEEFTDEQTGQDAEYEEEGQLTVDVFQDDNSVIIQSTIAGVSPEDLDVSITNDMVTIRGERRRTFEVEDEDYFYQECYWGAFSRSIILPVEIDADRAEAKIKNGILTVRIPKANTAVTRKLRVKSS